MKVINQQKRKNKEFQDRLNYDNHIKRINEISFRNKKSPDSALGMSSNYKGQINNKIQSPNQLINHSKIEKQRLVQMQNQRLMKKLNQIGRKKPTFNKQSKELKQYKTINMKSRRLHRDLKQRFIQQQNDQLVERLINKRNSPSALFQDIQRSKKPNRSQRRSNSLMLPQIATPLIPQLRD